VVGEIWCMEMDRGIVEARKKKAEKLGMKEFYTFLLEKMMTNIEISSKIKATLELVEIPILKLE
jgi:hypothetical protein